jgi:hypothetical protein
MSGIVSKVLRTSSFQGLSVPHLLGEKKKHLLRAEGEEREESEISAGGCFKTKRFFGKPPY